MRSLTRSLAKFLVLCLVLLSSSARAEEDSKIDFNGAGEVKPEFKKSFEFKTPDEADKNKKLDLIKDAENKNLFTTSVEYPKNELYFSFNPGIDGFTNTLSASRIYNYGGANITGLSAGYVYSPSIGSYLNLDLTYSSIAIAAFRDTGAGLYVAESVTQMLDLSMAFNLCRIYESTLHRLCPGFEMNYDSFPTLSFPQTSNAQINLQVVHDMSLGLNLDYYYPLAQNYQLISKLGYNYGLGLGQSSNLGTKNDQKISGRLGIEKSLQRNWFWNLIFAIDYRSATLQSALDTWKIEHLAYNVKIGFRYEL